MSTINVTNLSGRGGATPNLPDGANITGVATATSFDGNLKSTGTPTLGLGVTINASGVAISGVATAGIGSFTTVYGDGSNMTGVGESIGPWYYNPDVNDTQVDIDTGIGITFNKLVNMGSSGTATLKIVNAGVAGTTIQSWGISSVTQPTVTDITLGALVSDLIVKQTYQLDIPEGFLVSSTGTSYAGTAYTFTATDPVRKLWATGNNTQGMLGQNNLVKYSSPVQIPGATWVDYNFETCRQEHVVTRKSDGTLWAWGQNQAGQLGQGNTQQYSSPTQIPGTTWALAVPCTTDFTLATKTDGTLWGWGDQEHSGMLGQNSDAPFSSPMQTPGTTWRTTAGSISGGYRWAYAIKTDGTLWGLGGQNPSGELGQNNTTAYSSAVQIPGTTWNYLGGGNIHASAIKTDGTLWMWGNGNYGKLGQNEPTNADKSSPVQVPGTTWSKVSGGENNTVATKTDGTAWAWGYNSDGQLGQNSVVTYSSPVQIPGTNWSQLSNGDNNVIGLKTDGTLWGLGRNSDGAFGNNDVVAHSSPVQVNAGETGYTSFMTVQKSLLAQQLDQTP